MSLAAGTRIGSYEIVAPLGAGGMGEVYRARDARLGRDVAIKALPAAFAQDPERLARFEREAKLLASLNHPNIASIYAVEEKDGLTLLVMELVEGESLAQRLVRGPMSVEDALAACAQVAAGLEAAHDAGVVHRDLKPGNVMLRSDGAVKVLDFGLARGPESSGLHQDLSHSPTMTSPATAVGVVLGTAGYMSPEQAKGRPVDRRADIWSFGVVLFELLTGRKMFEGETASEVLASVMKDEIPWARLPVGLPPGVRGLLERCLTRDPRQRLQSIGEARIALERAHEPEPAAKSAERATPAWLTAIPWALLVLVIAFALLRGGLPGRHAASDGGQRHLELAAPPSQTPEYGGYRPVISPDGRWVVVSAIDSLKVSHLWLRSMASFDFKVLKGTEDGTSPFWSPDSRTVAFFAKGRLLRIGVEDGGIEAVTDQAALGRGGSWGPDGTILYTPSSNSGIWRVPATGGTPRAVTKLDTTIVDCSHRFPLWLPDGEHFLFALWSNSSREQAEHCGIYLASVRGGEPKRLTQDLGEFILLPDGALGVGRNGSLVAVPFDLRSFKLGSQPVVIADQVGFFVGSGFLMASSSAGGDIALAPRAEDRPTDFAWTDRQGVTGPPLGMAQAFAEARLSPDGSHAVGTRVDVVNGLDVVWTADLARRTAAPLTHSQNDSYDPVWSPDGQRIAFCNRDLGTDDLYLQAASGATPKQLHWSARPCDTDMRDWSHDGRWLFFEGRPRPGSRHQQVWALDLQTDSARVILQEDFDLAAPCLSPDGRWLAYLSSESGRDELFVRSFPDLQRKWQVSNGGASAPHWRADGRELLFANATTRGTAYSAVPVSVTGADLVFGSAQLLFTLQPDQVASTPNADHTRFLTVIERQAGPSAPIRVILGWHMGGR